MTKELIKQLEADIEYYNDYKKRLCQFVIHNSSYDSNSKLHRRVRLQHHQLLGILKEMQKITERVLLLKMLLLADINTFEFIIDKYLK